MVIKTLPIPSTKLPDTRQTGPKRSLFHSHSISCPPDHRNEQRRVPDVGDLRQMCILTKSDLNRIYGNLDRRQRDKDAVRQEMERKKEMSERAAQIAKEWPNTITGLRDRKIELRKLREQEEEERKKVLDIEEEKLAAERRREYIEKAKQTRYYNTDRVRTFHSSLILTEVLKERELQIEMKKRMEQMRQTNENEELQRFREAQTELSKIEQEKLEQRAKDRTDLAQYQITQINRRKSRYVQDKERNQQEGAEYRRLAEKSALEHMELEQAKKAKQKDVRKMFDKAVDDRQKVKEIERIMDEEEDEELRVYAQAKMKIARLKREKELQAEQEKQEARDEMIGFLGSIQKRAEADYDSQIFRAQAEKEAKQYYEAQEKYEKQQRMQESIDKHRLQTIKRREVERAMEEREDEERRRKKAESDRLFTLYQKEKERQRNQDSHILNSFQIKQVQERREHQRNLKANEVHEIQLDKQTNEIERQQYQEYTGNVMSYLEENGRNIYPMKRTVAEEMKRFDDFSIGLKKTETPRIGQHEEKPGSRNNPSLNETKKHLGFQWGIPQKS